MPLHPSWAKLDPSVASRDRDPTPLATRPLQGDNVTCYIHTGYWKYLHDMYKEVFLLNLSVFKASKYLGTKLAEFLSV